MSRLLVFCAVFLTAPCALLVADEVEERTEHETYIWLEREGVYDPDVPNSEVYDLLAKGIAHEDPKIVHCAISVAVMYTAWSSTLRAEGKQAPTDRQLEKTPGLYDLLIGLWEDGWKKSGGKVPEPQYPADHYERVVEKTGCVAPDPVWTSLSLPMATLFPGDEKVYDIIWKDLPSVGTVSILTGLNEGKFNNPKDQQFRIDLLKNPETGQYVASLAARGLGDLPAEQGLETLVSALTGEYLKWGVPELVIVEAMMKYKEEAVPHIPIMRETLERTPGLGKYREIRATLKERLRHFEERYATEEALPSH